MPTAPTMPQTVGDLRGFAVEIRCRVCGRVAPIDPEKLKTRSGRGIDRKMPLPRFLALLTCTTRACGAKPEQLHVAFRSPPPPGGEPGEPGIDRWSNWSAS